MSDNGASAQMATVKMAEWGSDLVRRVSQQDLPFHGVKGNKETKGRLVVWLELLGGF